MANIQVIRYTVIKKIRIVFRLVSYILLIPIAYKVVLSNPIADIAFFMFLRRVKPRSSLPSTAREHGHEQKAVRSTNKWLSCPNYEIPQRTRWRQPLASKHARTIETAVRIHRRRRCNCYLGVVTARAAIAKH